LLWEGRKGFDVLCVLRCHFHVCEGIDDGDGIGSSGQKDGFEKGETRTIYGTVLFTDTLHHIRVMGIGKPRLGNSRAYDSM
jgi:hypothetical protein